MRRRTGDSRGLAMTLSNLGTIANASGDYAEARRLYLESLSLLRRLRQPANIAVMLNNIADIEMHEKQYEKAILFFIHAERIFTDLKSPYAKEASHSLAALEEELGKEEYTRLHDAAARKAWEDAL